MRLGFGSRVERNIVATVLLAGLVPLALVAVVAMREIQSETLRTAERQLRDDTKTYALDVLNHFERAVTEIKLVHLSGDSAGATRYVDVVEARTQVRLPERVVITRGSDGFDLAVPVGTTLLTARVPASALLVELGHVPYGVNRCVQLDGVSLGCAGTTLEAHNPRIQASWTLPLSSIFATELKLVVTTEQLESVALEHVSLVMKLLPLAVLTIACVLGWFLLFRIRRAVAPLTQLQEATRQVRGGDYEHRVDLRTGDEFERLGHAFNLMTARLGSSFHKMQVLAEIDRLILSGAGLEEVVRRALLLAREICLNPCALYLAEGADGRGSLYRLEDELLEQVPTAMNGAERRGEALVKAMGGPVNASFEVRREGEPAGELFAFGSAELSAAEHRTLTELADRMSVAITNSNRAKELYQQANFDALTGLINRQAFTDRLRDCLAGADRRGQRMALLFLDLDRFKHVNDTEGHVAGDELLRVVATRLEDALRASDIVSRLGGDEFAIALPDFSDEKELTFLCERIVSVLHQPARLNGVVHNVDVSIGVAIYPEDGANSGALLKNADVAMYKAKEQLGSAFAFYDESLNQATERRVRVEARLREAIAEQSLELYFQPQLNVRTGRVEQVEGLLRWSRDDGDPLGPGEFIPVAEDTGLIHELTGSLVASSAACLRRSDELGLGLKRVAINLSSQLFKRPGLASKLLDELAAADLQADRLEVEMTESVFVDDVGLVRAELKKLRAAGVRIALDDFGTGYSSLNMLQSLPLDLIKIDHSFVAPLVESEVSRQLAAKIIQIARVLKLDVVAEGVESEAELAVLRGIDCDVIQGFLLSPALCADELFDLLAQHNGSKAADGHQRVVPLRR